MAIRETDGLALLYVNHELGHGESSEPVVGKAPVRGAFVSQWVLSPQSGEILSGDFAYDSVEGVAVPPPKDGAFGRFCSSTLAGPAQGFDRWIYFTGEEAEGDDSFDGKGGQAVAVMDRKAYLLPDLGRFRKENVIPLPTGGSQTMIFALEDGPDGLKSQLYLYLGRKDPAASSLLVRNGLVGGSLYVLSPVDSTQKDEKAFHKGEGSLQARWLLLPDAARLNEKELEKLSEKIGAFRFARIEDGAYDPKDHSVLYFVTTGDDPSNRQGRLYRVKFSLKDPISQPAILDILFEGDRGDPIYSPDNLAFNTESQLMILEDPSKLYWGDLPGGRESSVWLYELKTGALRRIAEVDQRVQPLFRRGPPGSWEPSGIIDASSLFGKGAWLLNVEAHSSGLIKALNYLKPPPYVEEGQILLLKTSQ